MTLEHIGIPSKRFDAFTRLYQRYLLEPSPAVGSILSVAAQIQPVTFADDLLRVTRLDGVEGDISVTAGTNVVYFTVPDGKRWTLVHAFLPGTTSNTKLWVGNNTTRLGWTPSSGSEAAIDMANFVIPEAWSLGLQGTGNAGDDERTLVLFYYEEDAF